MGTFEIGLVGAGAISAGAYTAGVMDYLIEALDAWHAVKKAEEGQSDDLKMAPPHEVKLSVFSGASAGGMTAAIAAGFLGSNQPHIHDENDAKNLRSRNKLFDSWVESIDITALLETHDLKDKSKPLASILDSSVLTGIAEAGFAMSPSQTRRAYVADNFKLFLAVTNLRGVPYSFPINGNISTNYGMSLHADYMEFTFSDGPTSPADHDNSLTWADLFNPNDFGQKRLKLALLATGAFPLGLAPRNLEHTFYPPQPDLYSLRKWPYTADNPPPCLNAKAIPADWGKIPSGFRYRFTCIDGGVMNNEPLELARTYLSGGVDRRNPRGGLEADKAVILIDPFPNESGFEPNFIPGEPDLIESALGMFIALIDQARFKPDELLLANDVNVYSRFVIAPSRDGMMYPIASGVLGGFGGFLHRSFRAHDYFLGRRNAQNFLRNHFALPQDNPLFSGWTDEMRQKYGARDAKGAPAIDRTTGQLLLQIIPVVDQVSGDCHLPPWPEYTSSDLEVLKGKISVRLDAVMDRLVEKVTGGGFIKLLVNVVLSGKRKKILEMTMDKIMLDLRKWGLLSYK